MTFTPWAAWAATPEPVRAAVAEARGAPIVGHRDLHGGMSPGPAVDVRLGDGRQVFVKAATDRACRLLGTLPPEASRFVVGLAGMWCIRAATVPDTVMPNISAWRRAGSAALRPLVSRLLRESAT